MRKIIKSAFLVFAALVLLFFVFRWSIKISPPEVSSTVRAKDMHRVQTGPFSYTLNNNWLRKNKQGIWEMYVEGSDYERGLAYGVLAKELMKEQEDYFVKELKDIIPGTLYQHVLRYFIGWFNRNIDEYIPDENLREIYGVSQSFSPEYNFIAAPYQRMLNYHAAHDIGHALNDFQLVGCTSFAVKDGYSKDSLLLIGRNFDFYLGDNFAKNKMILFVNPQHGYPFASYSWAGFTGVVSGMNVKGLTVTINAAKSDVPLAAKDPISLLAREILQYAKNTEEAWAIANKRETFVSETIMIGSANDNHALLIEKSPTRISRYESGNGVLVCSNHYQSTAFSTDESNRNNLLNSDSQSRYERMNQLLNRTRPLDVEKAASVLRNKQGLNDAEIGYGNPKAINQLIAHHGVIFKPSSSSMWVSAWPYQEGEFVYYNLDSIFNKHNFVHNDTLNIPSDTFLLKSDYIKYESFKEVKQRIVKLVRFGIPLELTDDQIKNYIANNPKSYITYESLGNYFMSKKQYSKATGFFQQSLKCDVASLNERIEIKDKLDQSIAKQN